MRPLGKRAFVTMNRHTSLDPVPSAFKSRPNQTLAIVVCVPFRFQVIEIHTGSHIRFSKVEQVYTVATNFLFFMQNEATLVMQIVFKPLRSE